jgi:glycosyltransferase involved in cell wall biosynthesis
MSSNVNHLPVVGVVVTHNSQEFLPELLASITNQTQQLDQLIVIDDRSSDRTTSILSEHGITPTRASSQGTDLTTRIAQNFQQGVKQAPRNAIVILGDHDDVWRPDRVQHQAQAFMETPLLAMLASDGKVNDLETLRTTFLIPANWSAMSKSKQFTYALRHSIATGGASAIRASNFNDINIPSGWLHDRWWSLAATAQGRMALDSEIVIDYRITPTQQVGLDTAQQDASTRAWIVGHARNLSGTAGKFVDLMRLGILARR